MNVSVNRTPNTYADVSPIFTPSGQNAQPTVPAQLPHNYANGQRVYDFQPNALGGQAGRYQIYDETGAKRLNVNTSVDGHIGFAQSYNPNGTAQSSTIYGKNGQANTMTYGPT